MNIFKVALSMIHLLAVYNSLVTSYRSIEIANKLLYICGVCIMTCNVELVRSFSNLLCTPNIF